MKDVLLLHDNTRPHTSLRTREAIAKLGLTVLPRPAHSPDLAHSDYNLVGPVKDALCGCHFVDDNELKHTFLMCSEVGEDNFTTLMYNVLLSVGRSVLKMTEAL
jgi:hypothetical protein